MAHRKKKKVFPLINKFHLPLLTMIFKLTYTRITTFFFSSAGADHGPDHVLYNEHAQESIRSHCDAQVS